MATSYEITGTVHQINDEQTFGSGFTKREFVINDNAEKYPQLLKLEAVKDKCNHLNSYSVGDPITVSVNLRGNEHNGKYYVALQAWKFDRAATDRPAQGARSPEFGQPAMRPAQDVHNTAKANAYQPDADGGDDIPF